MFAYHLSRARHPLGRVFALCVAVLDVVASREPEGYGKKLAQDTGNKVILQFVKRVLAKSLHPMVDVLSLLVWRHLEACFISSYKPWCRDGLKEIKATWIVDVQALEACKAQVEHLKLVLVPAPRS